MKNVLIVDDEKSFLLSLKDGLSLHNDKFQVVTAENGQEAVSMLRDMPIDLLVTDLKLPKMDGFELLAWTSRQQPQLPVIVMTAFGTPEIEARLAKMETLQYLEKPLDLEMLQEGIFNGLNAGTKSYIRGITLATFLQLMSIEKKNCTLKVSAAGQTGYLYIRRGELLDAEYGESTGEAAALEIVSWDNAEIEMDGVCRQQDSSINASLEHLLIEAFRLKDEKANGLRPEQPFQQSATAESSQGVDEKVFAESTAPEKFPASQLLSPDELAYKRLVEALTKLAAVEEYAIFDQNSVLAKKNSGPCSLEDVDPAIYTQLIEPLAAEGFGSFGFLTFNSASRTRYLLLQSHQHRVLAKLKPGTQPQPLVKEIRRYVNR